MGVEVEHHCAVRNRRDAFTFASVDASAVMTQFLKPGVGDTTDKISALRNRVKQLRVDISLQGGKVSFYSRRDGCTTDHEKPGVCLSSFLMCEPPACCFVGTLLYNGTHCSRDPNHTAEYYTRGVAGGNSTSIRYPSLYRRDSGEIELDLKHAFNSFNDALKVSNTDASSTLAIFI